MNPHYFMGTIPINPNNFPAKMWSLVINPKNPSIRWDASGEGVIIDQQLFEAELLSPQMRRFDGRLQHVDVFKTFKFTSFVRQLNLYGFKKVVVDPDKQEDGATGRSPTSGILHHFHNPHFRQDRPELLVNLKRLTSSNKAKMKAGLEVNCRPPNRFPRLRTANGGRPKVEKRGSVYVGPELLVYLKSKAKLAKAKANKAKMKAGLEVNCRPPNRFPRLPTANGGRPKIEKRGSVYIIYQTPIPRGWESWMCGLPVKMEEHPINASQKQHQGEGRRGRGCRGQQCPASVCPRRPKAADSNLNLQI